MENPIFFGVGSIINYNPEEVKNYSVKDLKRLIKQTRSINAKEYRYSTKYYYETVGKSIRFTYFLLEFFSLFISEEFDNEYERLVINEKKSIVDSYAEAFYNVYDIKTCTKPFVFRLDQEELEETVDEILERIMLNIELMIYNELIRSVKHDYVLRTKTFKNWFFHKLSTQCKGIIIDECDIEQKRIYSNEFHIPVIESDEKFENKALVLLDGTKNKIYRSPSKEKIQSMYEKLKNHTYEIGEHPKYAGTNIKLYTPFANARQLEKAVYGEWYHGIGPIKSEFLYAVKNEVPSRMEQLDYYYEVFKKAKEKEIIVSVPDFNPYKKSANMDNDYTDVDLLLSQNDLFLNHFYAIAEASRMVDKRIKVAVPMLRMSNEFSIWKDTISLAFEACDAMVPEIGIYFETESSLEFFEDYKDMDFAIIGLDNLIDELSDTHDRYTPISMKELKALLWPHIRDLHQYLRSYKINVRQIVSGKCLLDPTILRKFIATGFTEFVIPVTHVRLIEDALEDHMLTRGKYIGVAEEREQYKRDEENRKLELEKIELDKKIEKLKEKNKKRAEKEAKEKEEHERKKKKALDMILSKKDDEDDEDDDNNDNEE
jgi:hypothetical protein